VNWIREANGIEFDYHNLYLSFAPNTGRIISFYSNWGEATFPDPGNVISAEEAVDIFLASLTPRLYYIIEQTWDAETGRVASEAEARLIYTHTDYQGVMVEAVEGRLLVAREGTTYRASGEPYFSDMDGHPAQQMVEKLAAFGVFRNTSGIFDPTGEMSQKDYLNELHLLLSQGYWLRDQEYMYTRLLADRIVDAEEMDATAAITAEQALKFLLRKDGHREVAEMFLIFRVPGRIPFQMAGYAAIGSHLGLLDLDTWQAAKPLNRLEVAKLFYNFLLRP